MSAPFTRIVCTLLLVAGVHASQPTRALPEENADWVRVSTEHFELHSNASPRKASRVVRRLEQLREALAETSRGMTLNSPVPTRIFIFRSRASFEPYVFSTADESPNVAGYFLRTDSANYVAIDASADSVPYPTIYHEYLHYFLENNVPGIPLWLNEGLAEFYSSFSVRDGKAEIGRPIERHLLWLRSHDWIPLDELFSVDTSSTAYHEDERQGTFYAQSWLLAHYLLTDPQKRGQIGTLFDRLSNGQQPWAAFAEAYDIDASTLTEQLVAHFADGANRFYTYTPDERFEDHEVSLESVGRTDLLVGLGDLLAHCCPEKATEAERHLTAAISLDDDRVDARLSLAALKLTRSEIQAAKTLCSEATRLEPNNARAHAMHGAAILQGYAAALDEGSRLPENPATAVIQSRESFRSALALDPGDLTGQIGLGRTFLFQTEDVDEGVAALERAHGRMPARLDLLFEWVVLEARAGHVDRARTLLESRLRPRGDARLADAAEAEIVDSEWASISAMLARGENAEAVARLTEVADSVHNPELQAQLQQEIRKLTGDVAALETANDHVELHNRAVAMLNSGQLEDAATLFERVAETAEDATLAASARTNADDIRRALRHEAHLVRFEEAVQKIKQQDLVGAEREFVSLLEENLDPELRQRVAGLLAEIRRHAN